MDKLFFITLLLLCFVAAPAAKGQTEAQRIDLCVKAAGDANYLSDYPVHLSGVASGEKAPVFRKAIALRKGNRYRFTLCTDEESKGEGILRLFDENLLIGSTYNSETGVEYQSFDFDCRKSAFYIMFISFKDGKEGSAIGILSHVKTL